MKKYFLMAALVLSGATAFIACSDDNDDSRKHREEAINLDYTSANAQSWGNYAVYVADLLLKDAQSLEDAWVKSYQGGAPFATTFKAHNTGDYKTALSAVEQIVNGCVTIAGEVGEAKIGDPINKWQSNQREEAVFAVESWYSWHSRDDYTNNIYSIRNAFYGTIDGTRSDDFEKVPSLFAFLGVKKQQALREELVTKVEAAAKAIQAIPQPFRNNIGSAEAKAAQEACFQLKTVLDNKLKPFLTANTESTDEAMYDKIVTHYVDVVVVPTYRDLTQKTAALKAAVVAFKAAPSNTTFKAAADAWISARQPWETSEAFLFGPVSALGLDPNMDSWPLDQVGIVNVLKSGKYSDLQWSGEYKEDDKTIEAAQTLRGFHTLEYLLFKDGKPRVVK